MTRYGSILSFQSTHPRGVRPCTRGSTPCCRGYFNPRTHVGCDTEAWRWRSFRRDFNPRTHVGCDRLLDRQPPVPHHFNPRTHVGCDVRLHADSRVREKFQSTHPRGVRLARILDRHALSGISIHAPTWGATGSQRQCGCPLGISIHAPTWGATGAESGV